MGLSFGELKEQVNNVHLSGQVDRETHLGQFRRASLADAIERIVRNESIKKGILVDDVQNNNPETELHETSVQIWEETCIKHCFSRKPQPVS